MGKISVGRDRRSEQIWWRTDLVGQTWWTKCFMPTGYSHQGTCRRLMTIKHWNKGKSWQSWSKTSKGLSWVERHWQNIPSFGPSRQSKANYSRSRSFKGRQMWEIVSRVRFQFFGSRYFGKFEILTNYLRWHKASEFFFSLQKFFCIISNSIFSSFSPLFPFEWMW